MKHLQNYIQINEAKTKRSNLEDFMEWWNERYPKQYPIRTEDIDDYLSGKSPNIHAYKGKSNDEPGFGDFVKPKKQKKAKVTKVFGKDFTSSGNALTLGVYEVVPDNIGRNRIDGYKEYEKTHPDGWTIKGMVHEDYYMWVNDFEASHPKYGKVWGNFEDEVYADSEKGFRHFYKNHTPDEWDYGDI